MVQGSGFPAMDMLLFKRYTGRVDPENHQGMEIFNHLKIMLYNLSFRLASKIKTKNRQKLIIKRFGLSEVFYSDLDMVYDGIHWRVALGFDGVFLLISPN